MKRLFFRGLVAVGGILCVVAMGSGVAPAEPVTVLATFNSFKGQVGSNFQFVTFIDSGAGPTIVCPDAGCGSGVGVASIPLSGDGGVEFWSSSFGVDSTHNKIRFTSSGLQDVLVGQEFLLGRLTYANGIWFADPEFSVTFTTADNAHVWDDTIHLSVTPNLATNTPAQNADFIYLTNLRTLGSIRAYELADSPTGSNEVTVEVYGKISSLDLTRFANPTGGGFIDASVDLEPTPVPAPAALVLLGIGLAGVGWIKRSARHTN